MSTRQHVGETAISALEAVDVCVEKAESVAVRQCRMAGRTRNRSSETGSTGSTRDGIVDGIAWEIQTALVAIPALVVAGIVALLFDASVTMVLVVGFVVALVLRLAVDGWRRLSSSEPARSRPPRQDL